MALMFTTFTVFALTASRSTTSVDVYDTSLASWRIAETGTPWLDDFDLDSLGKDTELLERFIAEAPNGHIVVHRAPGPIAVTVPAYAIAPGDEFRIWPQALLAAALTAAAVMLLFAALRNIVPSRTATVASFAFAFASPVWTVAGNGMWPHTLTVLGICGMAWAASAQRWWIVGLMGGVALWGRVHAALIVAILGVGVALARRHPTIALKAGLVSSAFMGLASLWTHWMYGRWSPTGGYESGEVLNRVATADSQGGSGLLTNQLGMWVAPDRGILVWTPVILLLLPALVRSWTNQPDWTRWLLVAGLTYTIAQAWYSPFHGGDAFFGYRLGLEFLASAVPALACSWVAAGRFARTLMGPILGLQVAAFSLGAMANGLFLDVGKAWSDNVVFAAAREVPILWLWLTLGVALGALAQRIISERSDVVPG